MLKRLFDKHISDNLGLINLFGKAFGRTLYLILVAYFSYKLSIKHFAEFAIFWTSLRMFTFYGANNLYIIYFNKVRNHLIDKKSWPHEVSSNVVITSVIFCLITGLIAMLLFDGLRTALILVACLACYIIIRNVAEFAKADNNLFLSIFIDDFLFYVLFFIFSFIGLSIANDVIVLMYALLFASILTAMIGIILFIKKFDLKFNSYTVSLSEFSFKDFKLGVNYTFLRGNEVLSNFAVRYLGQIYFGDLFVAYAHIMYQFYNIFSLLTMSVVSGLQSKITVKSDIEFNRSFFNISYKKIQKTVLPFVLILIAILILFNEQILIWFFPKFVSYKSLLVKVGFAGLIFAIIQPLVFILVYNNRFINIIKLNYTQYLVMLSLFSLPLVFPNFNQEYWFLLIMISLVVVQGTFAWLNYNNIK